ncbi:MAG TPA: amidase [Deltaproteobacteria bacterium]|nr:amidase [Deltaproteobacteria bacterium]
MSLNDISATQAVDKIRKGEITSEELVQDCLDKIEQIDGETEAWAYLNPDYALEQARRLDIIRQAGDPMGPLHGIPVGIKDIIDTAHVPTELGTPIHSGRIPFRDAWVVSRLRQAGAVIMGKTVTTELATYAPGKTKNPHDPNRTPGGSSSGSAAAVASNMVPAALGSQTNGSIIRPAAFCGVFGFKPSFGMIPRTGVLKQSSPLDQLGVFARSMDDVALLTQVLAGYDEVDPSTTYLRAVPPLVSVAAEDPPLPPKIGFVKTPVWDRADDICKDAHEELCESLGENIEEIELSLSFGHVLDHHKIIMETDLAYSYAHDYERAKDLLSDSLRGQIERGLGYSAVAYQRALAQQAILDVILTELFQVYDALLTPSASGEAPIGLDNTGDPSFCTIWTFCGVPALNIPVFKGENGMPIGTQLVGAKNDDARLLRTANWLLRKLNE